MIYFENCKNILAVGNSFYNIRGNIFIAKNTSFLVENFKINISYCSYDFGGVFNLQKGSILLSKDIFLENVINEKDGGFLYVEESELFIENMVVSNTKSFNYAGCIFGISSIVNFSKINISEFQHGCIYLTDSSVNIINSSFHFNVDRISNNNNHNEYCWSILCFINTISLNIVNSVFKRNINQTYYGGVFLLN